MTRTPDHPKPFLRRLKQNEAGNTLAITAAAVVPLMALIGGGVDISRYYVVKSQLQSACDSAALAARKAMVGNTWTTDAETVGENFFSANYPSGAAGTTGSNVTLTSPTAGVVQGVATVNAAPTLMSMFGASNKVINVACSAKMLLPNTDIMFALDTTGSMANTNPSDTVARIEALRGAVNSFYATLAAAAPSGVQLRYGFVPFSSTVNVGRLLRREWMVDTANYQSRLDDGTSTSGGSGGSPTTTQRGGWTKDSGTKVTTNLPDGSLENCVPFAADTYNSSSSNTEWEESDYSPGKKQKERYNLKTENGIDYTASISGGRCKRTQIVYTDYKTRRKEKVIPVPTPPSGGSPVYKWNYKQRDFDVSALKGGPADGASLMTGNSFDVAKLANGHNTATIDWAGCIEERKTLRPTESAVKAGEPFDLNIDLVPDAADDETRWRPFLPKLVYWRQGSKTNWTTADHRTSSNNTRSDSQDGGQSAACPSASRKLAAMSASDVSTYLNTLVPNGYTSLDIGMLWAARLISPTGLFASENAAAADGTAIQRHIIYLTDGEIETRNYVYDAYGLPALDRRRTSASVLPTDTVQDTIVGDRFTALCQAAKDKGITVWVIAFGTSLTTQLTNCASSGRAFQADDAASLNTTFADIAANIAQLRLTE